MEFDVVEYKKQEENSVYTEESEGSENEDDFQMPCRDEMGNTDDTKDPLAKKKKQKRIRICVILLVIVSLWAGVFHLWGDDAIAYDLLMENIYSFKCPSSVHVVSGWAGDFSSTSIGRMSAHLSIRAQNLRGTESVDRYYISSDDEGIFEMDYSKTDRELDRSPHGVNAWKINLRLRLYWIFH